ncbi:Endonuclease YncB, thermonuclease family [Candidatus Methanophagaceae archaeon]|nr:Endonuclease YncB, thermonuclease family [Methanophagales archaeon]
MKGLCEGKEVYLDIDDIHIIDKYGRIVAVVYIHYNETHRVNLNQLLLIEGYAEAKDYPNEFNPDVWMESPLEYVDMTPTPEPTITPTPSPSPGPTISSIHTFGFLFTILGIVAAIYLIRRKREGI